MPPALVGAAGAFLTGAAASPVSPLWGVGSSQTAGNRLILVCVGTGAAILPTTPLGWNVAAQINPPTGYSLNVTIFDKVAAGGDAAPTITAQTGMGWNVQLCEYSGVDTTPGEEQFGVNNTNTLAAIVAAGASADAAPGNLVIMAGSARFTVSATQALTHTPNNGVSFTQTQNNNASAVGGHHYWGYGVTNSNSVPDNDSFGYPTTSLIGAEIAIASFKAAAPIPPITDAPETLIVNSSPRFRG